MRPRNLLLLCAFIAAGVAGYALLAPSGLPKLRHKERELALLQSDVARLESENARLLAEAGRLKDGAPDQHVYLETAAREELGWLRPDEHVLLLPSASGDPGASDDSASNDSVSDDSVSDDRASHGSASDDSASDEQGASGEAP